MKPVSPSFGRNSFITSTITILTIASLMGVIAGIVVISNVNVMGGSILTAGSGVLLIIDLILISLLLARSIRRYLIAFKEKDLASKKSFEKNEPFLRINKQK